MLLLTFLSRRWLWKAVCKAGGTTPEAVREKSAELTRTTSSGRSLQANFDYWMMQNAPDPKKYRRLKTLYSFCILPNFLCLFFAFGGLHTHAFDKILQIGMYVVPVIIVVVGVVGIWYNKHHSE